MTVYQNQILPGVVLNNYSITCRTISTSILVNSNFIISYITWPSIISGGEGDFNNSLIEGIDIELYFNFNENGASQPNIDAIITRLSDRKSYSIQGSYDTPEFTEVTGRVWYPLVRRLRLLGYI